MQQEIDRRDLTEPDIRVTPVREIEPDINVTRTSTQVVMPRDRVRWGPIWAGLITALTSFLVLELLAYGLGWLTLDVNPGVGQTSGPWASIIIGLIAFFLGGWVAGATTALRGTSVGLVAGFLVWGLGTVLILGFSVLGAGRFFGALGGIIGQFQVFSNPNFLASLGNVDPGQVAQAARNFAWWAFWSLVASAVAATVGGWTGVKSGPLGKFPKVDATH